MDKNKCSSCGGEPKGCPCKNKDFTKAVIEIDNHEKITLMRRVVIPASMGDDTVVPPVVGKYHNVLLYYEANQKSYLYSSDGIPTQLVNGVTDYEAAINLPQINGNTLIGDKTGEELGLQDKLIAGDNITIEGNTISATDTTYGPATEDTIGLVKPGEGLEVDSNGSMSISQIERYALFFDTVSDMKAATNLKSGGYAKTLGYYTRGDNGGSIYKIRNRNPDETTNEATVLSLHETGLVAELLIEEEMNVTQFGMIGDGVTDESERLAIALSCAGNNFIKLTLDTRTYLAQREIPIYSNTHIDLNGGTIKSCCPSSESTYIRFGNGLRFLNNIPSLATAGYGAIKNFKVKNGTLDGGDSGVGIFILHGEDISFEDVLFNDCCTGTHIFDLGGCKDVEIINCIFDGYGIPLEADRHKEMIQTDYATRGGLPYWNDSLTIAYDALPCNGVTVRNCTFSSKPTDTYSPSSIGTHSASTTCHKNILIEGNTFNETSYYCIRFPKVQNCVIRNNKFSIVTGELSSIRCIWLQSTIVEDQTEPYTKNVIIEDNISKVSGTPFRQFVYIDGSKDDSNNLFVNNIIIRGNSCTGDWNGENDNRMGVQITNAEDVQIYNNTFDNFTFPIIKTRLSFFKNSVVHDNIIKNSNAFLHRTANDSEEFYTDVNIEQSDNIWIDETTGARFNINNFKLALNLDIDFVATEDSQTYYVLDFAKQSAPIATLYHSGDYNIELPSCVTRFKITPNIVTKSSTDDSAKIFRVRVDFIDPTTDEYVCSAQQTIPAGEWATVTVPSCIVNENQLTTRYLYKIAVEAYLSKDDIVYAKSGTANQTTLFIEGF